MLKRRKTDKTSEEILIEALREAGVECELRKPGDPPPHALNLTDEGGNVIVEFERDFNLFDTHYLTPETSKIVKVNKVCKCRPAPKKHKYLREACIDGAPYFPYSQDDYPEFDPRDTFNLDCTMLMWLYERLRYMQDVAAQTVDFEWHKFEIDGEELTLLECIGRMVDCCRALLSTEHDEPPKRGDQYKDILFKILAKVFWYLGW